MFFMETWHVGKIGIASRLLGFRACPTQTMAGSALRILLLALRKMPGRLALCLGKPFLAIN